MIGDILQPTHLLFILVVALLVLGPKRLPEVGRALGRGLRDFRNALNTDELREQMIATTSITTPTEHTDTPLPSEPAAPPTDTAEPVTSTPPTETSSEPSHVTPSSEPLAPAPEPVAPAADRSS